MGRTLRKPDHPIDRMFVERWSPRSFSRDEISETTLLTMLEAARWAPSSFNAQPWRFIYARRNSAAWPDLLSMMIEFNRSWAERAAALVLFVSASHLIQKGDRKTWPSHAFDAGSAWAGFAIQAHLLGWHTHAMSGFDHDAARRVLAIPEDFTPQALVAVGRLGPAEALPEHLRSREAPSDRLPLSAMAFEGRFKD